jgi:phage terminase small subunit
MLASSVNHSAIDDLNNLSIAEKHLDQEPVIRKDDLKFDMYCIAYDERLETEEEVKKRKEEAEKNAAADKNAKKKPPPAKGAPV